MSKHWKQPLAGHLFPVVPCGSLWFPVVPCGSLWFPVVPCGSLWFPVVPCGSLLLFVVPSGIYIRQERQIVDVLVGQGQTCPSPSDSWLQFAYGPLLLAFKIDAV